MSWELPEIVAFPKHIDEWSDTNIPLHSWYRSKMTSGVSWLRVIIIVYTLFLYFVPPHAALYQYNFQNMLVMVSKKIFKLNHLHWTTFIVLHKWYNSYYTLQPGANTWSLPISNIYAHAVNLYKGFVSLLEFIWGSVWLHHMWSHQRVIAIWLSL